MIKSTRLRTMLSASTILAAGLLLVAAPAQAQNLPDTGNVSVSTRGLSGGAPGSTDPGFSTSGAAGAQTLRVDLKDNRTILNWGGTGFNVAAGNTVDFKDARATSGVAGRTDNMAVLNRDLSGSASNILGTIESDPNVAVYVINQSGILFGDNANVNTGAFFAGTSDLSDDNDFLNAAATLRFSGSSGGTITANAGSQFTTAASASSNGGRMGDLVMMGSQVLFRGAAGNATSGGAAGDVALIAADDAAIMNTPGSPLSIQIYKGTALFNGLEVGAASTIRGQNVTLAYAQTNFASGSGDNVNILGNLVATGAQVTDRGVVLSAGAPIGNVGIDLSNTNGFGSINQVGNIDSAAGVLSNGIGHSVHGTINAAGAIDFGGEFVSSYTTAATITGASVKFGQIANLQAKVRATAGNVTSNNMTFFYGGVDATGDVVVDGFVNAFTLGAPGAQVGGMLKVNALSSVKIDGAVNAASVDIKTNADLQLSNSVTTTGSVKLNAGSATITGNISAGSADVDIETTGNLTIDLPGSDFTARKLVSGGTMSLTAGNILLPDVTAGNDIIVDAPNGLAQIVNAKAGGRISLSGSGVYLGGDAFYGPTGMVTAGGDIDVTASNQALFQGSISTDGNLTASGANGIMFGQFNVPGAITLNAKGALTLTATNGSIGVNGASVTVALQSNSDGIGTEALTLNALSGINLPRGSILAGTSRQSDLQIRLGGSGDIDLGPIQARGILSAQTLNGALVDGLILPNGRVNFTGSVNLANGLRAQSINFGLQGGMTLADGNLDIQAVNAVSIAGAINANDVLVRVGSSGNFGNLFVASGTSFTGHDVVLSSGSFSSGGAIGMHLSGHWVVYSSSPFDDRFGGLDSGTTALWNASLITRDPSTISGNRYVFSYQPKLTFLSQSSSKVYGTDLTGATSLPFDVSGYQPGVAGAFLGDTAATAYSGLPSFTSPGFAARASVAGGRYLITIGQGSLQSGSGYGFTFSSNGLLAVTQKVLTADVFADSKTYDGTKDASGRVVLNGVVAGDTVGTTGTTFTFTDKNAGTGKTVYVLSTSLAGLDAGNYDLTPPPTTAFADILKKALTAGVTADNKTYDGTTIATGTVILNGVVAGDAVGTSGTTFTFSDKNAGAHKTVAVAGTALTGGGAGNYTLAVSASVFADILKKALTTSVTASNKTYDGTTTATGTVTLNGVVSGDAVGTRGTTFAFADKNAGTGKIVTVSGMTLTGTDSGNYSVTVPASALADILKKALTANVTANNKTYDGTTAGTGTVTLNGVVSGDTIGTSGTSFAFADKNAGTGKTVNVSGTALTGADAGNYTVTIPASALADILKKTLTASVTANNKTYDGTTTGTGTIALNGVVAGDAVGASGTTFTFADKNAGTGKSVAVAGTSLTGADAGNYTVTVPASALADILKKAITASIVANNKTYDGTTAGTGTVTLNGLVTGDAVTAGGTTFTFADKNAGIGKAVAVTGTTIGGADAGNYTITIPASALGDILKRALAVTADDASKVQKDPDPALTFTLTSGSLVAGDVFSGGVARDSGENPGTYAIKIGTLSAGNNYTITFTPGTFTINLPLSSERLQPALKAQPLPSQLSTDQPASSSSVDLQTSAVCGDDKNCTTGNPTK